MGSPHKTMFPRAGGIAYLDTAAALHATEAQHA